MSTSARNYFFLLLILILIASTNLGLVNNILAFKASDGTNLLGIRDVLIMLALMWSAWHWRRIGKEAVRRSPSAKAVLAIVFLTPLAALVGFFFGASSLEIAREALIMLGWCLALGIGVALQDRRMLGLVCNVLIVFAVTISLGVFAEILSLGAFRVVTPGDIVSVTLRPTPSGWPLMMIGSSLAFALLMFERSKSFVATGVRLACLLTILAASFLTQSRTLIVGWAVSSVLTIVFVLFTRVRKVRWGVLIVGIGLIPLLLQAALSFGERNVRSDFSDIMLARYAVVQGYSAALEYSESDTRRAEIEIGLESYQKSPLFGLGLGTPYRFTMYQGEEEGVLVHNIFAYFLFRYGLPGFVAFVAFTLFAVRALFMATRDRDKLAPIGIGLAAGVVNLLVCGVFGNVFAMPYGTPIAMVAVGGLIAYEHLRAQVDDQPVNSSTRYRRLGNPARYHEPIRAIARRSSAALSAQSCDKCD